jgi:S-layer homology domain
MRTDSSRNDLRLRNFAAAIALHTLAAAGCCFRNPPAPTDIVVDPDGNGILEPGETVIVEPAWKNRNSIGCSTSDFGGWACCVEGPLGPTYSIVDPIASYDIPWSESKSCSSTGNCYGLAVSNPDIRPATHWDIQLTESVSQPNGPDPLLGTSTGLGLEPLSSTSKVWVLHVGNSFSDVPPGHPFYPYVENLLHHGVTSGCGEGAYCPGSSILRDQMAVFLLKARYGSGYVPPSCAGMFEDVPCPGPFTDWVEEAFTQGVIGDCGSPLFCPAGPVPRSDMAMFLLKAGFGSDYQPPPATGIFQDVPAADPSAPWIEEIYHLQVTAGCSSSPLRYCPDLDTSRSQMAAFFVKLWKWQLYGV